MQLLCFCLLVHITCVWQINNRNVFQKNWPLLFSFVLQEISRIEASIEKSTKQLHKHKEDLNRWAKRYRDAEKALTSLKQEMVSSNPDRALNLYVERKDSDLQQNKINLKFTHMQKINSIYNMEFEHWKEMTNTGFALLNQFYLLIRANGKADKEMKEQISKLYKLCQGRQKVVKFLEDEVTTNNDKENAELSFGTMTSITDSPVKSGSDAPSTGKKRPNSDSDTRNGHVTKMAKVGANSGNKKPSTFVKPKAVKSINFTANGRPDSKSVF